MEKTNNQLRGVCEADNQRSRKAAVTPLAFTYESLNAGDQIECEDFWHSGILSWQQGTVVFALGRKLFCPNYKYASSQFIFPHRMQNYRPCKSK